MGLVSVSVSVAGDGLNLVAGGHAAYLGHGVRDMAFASSSFVSLAGMPSIV